MRIEEDTKIYRIGTVETKVARVDMVDLGENRMVASLEYQGRKPYMEDRALIISDFCDDDSLVAVFDGHRGYEVADFLKENTEKVFLDEIKMNKADPKVSLEQTVFELDKQIAIIPELRYAGSAAVWALLESHRIIIANVGDCEAVLNRNGEAILLTEKHNIKSEAELKRVKDEGVHVSDNGYLEVDTDFGLQYFSLTRTLGDKGVNEPLISNEPFVTEINLREGDTDLILASDGLWSVVSYQEAVDVARSASDSVEVVSNLKQLAIERGSTDNISVIVVKLK